MNNAITRRLRLDDQSLHVRAGYFHADCGVPAHWEIFDVRDEASGEAVELSDDDLERLAVVLTDEM
jgi:hypothetical protein